MKKDQFRYKKWFWNELLYHLFRAITIFKVLSTDVWQKQIKSSSYGVSDGKVMLREYMNVNVCIYHGQIHFLFIFLWFLNVIQFVQLCSSSLIQSGH